MRSFSFLAGGQGEARFHEKLLVSFHQGYNPVSQIRSPVILEFPLAESKSVVTSSACLKEACKFCIMSF